MTQLTKEAGDTATKGMQRVVAAEEKAAKRREQIRRTSIGGLEQELDLMRRQNEIFDREAKRPVSKRLAAPEIAREARVGQRAAAIAVFDPAKAQKFENLQRQIHANQKKFTQEAERSRSSIGQMLNDFGRIAKFSILFFRQRRFRFRLAFSTLIGVSVFGVYVFAKFRKILVIGAFRTLLH